MLFKTKMNDGTLPVDALYEALINDFLHENHGDPCAYHTPDSNVRDFAFNHLLNRYYGKYTGSSEIASQVSLVLTSEEKKQKTLASFLEANVKCASMSPKFKTVLSSFSEMTSTVLGEARLLTWNVFGNFELSSLLNYNNGAHTSVSNMLSTPEVFGKRASAGRSRSGIKAYPFKYGVDDLVFTSVNSYETFKLMCHESSWLSTSLKDIPVAFTSVSSLSLIEKDNKSFRCIEPQPNGTVMVQLRLGEAMSIPMRKFGIDIRDQSKNQSAALSGVAEGYSTLDLTNASGLICCGLVDYVYGDCNNLLQLLYHNRIPYINVPGVDEPITAEYFSGMGNGYTFPMETWLFYALARSVCKILKLPVSGIRVYGDDIVVPNKAFKPLMQVLEDIGMQPNLNKSFGCESLFRESCGTDSFDGQYVTAPRPRGSWDTEVLGLHQFINDLMEWAEFHKFLIPHTLMVVDKLLYEGCVNVVPPWESAISGLKVSHTIFPYKWDVFLQCRTYQYYIAEYECKTVKLWTESKNCPPWQNWRSNIAAALIGAISHDPISIKANRKRTSKTMYIKVSTERVAYKEHSSPKYLSIHKVDEVDSPINDKYRDKRYALYWELISQLRPSRERSFLFDHMDGADPVYQTGVGKSLALSAALSRSAYSAMSTHGTLGYIVLDAAA